MTDQLAPDSSQSVDALPPVGDAPRSYAWIFVRLSGVLLLGLAALHVADRYLVHDVEQVTALTMATRWENAWWRLADFAFVALAVGHALVGLHWAARRRLGDGTGRLVIETGGAIVLGSLGLLAAWDRPHLSLMITYLPPVIAPRTADRDTPDDHPMRKVTRQVAFDPAGWTPERSAKVTALFDDLADDWNRRDKPGREEPLADALERGTPGDGRCLEVGSGTGIATRLLASRFRLVVAVDLSFAMLVRAPVEPAPRVQGDAARLPFPDRSFDSIALQNAFLFPHEVDRLLHPSGTVVWVSSVGPLTPIYLSAEEVVDALPGDWSAVASDAGEGSWCVARRSLS